MPTSRKKKKKNHRLGLVGDRVAVLLDGLRPVGHTVSSGVGVGGGNGVGGGRVGQWAHNASQTQQTGGGGGEGQHGEQDDLWKIKNALRKKTPKYRKLKEFIE